MPPLRPPPVSPTIPPSTTPGKPRVTWASLLGKPATLEEAGVTETGDAPLTGPLQLNATGAPPLKLQRNESAAGSIRTVIEIKRNGVTKGFIALDASDRIAVLHSDGTTVLMYIELTGIINALDKFKAPHLEATTDVKTPKVLDANGDQVVSTQQGAIANGSATSGSAGGTDGTGGPAGDPATLGDVDGVYAVTNAHQGLIADAQGTANTALTKANAALGAMRTHGLIDT